MINEGYFLSVLHNMFACFCKRKIGILIHFWWIFLAGNRENLPSFVSSPELKAQGELL